MSLTETEQILSIIPGDALEGLRRADRLWHTYKHDTLSWAEVVKRNPTPLGSISWDVVICGGTLGILLGCALAQRGWRVALVERGKLRGRDQEWNISRSELETFVELGLLTSEELEQAIATTYNPARIAFDQGIELWVRDVLNIGIDPVFLLETLKTKFLQAGGQLFEHSSFEAAVVHPDGVNVEVGGRSLTTRMLIDAMGHFSPITQQARQGQKPDAVCLVVGTCAQGFPVNETGDLIVSFTPMQNHCQYFWEAFPARDGRTTYMFTYMDVNGDRPDLADLFADYLHLLPQYQNIELAQLQIQRALFGFFPSYRQSPLQTPWSRILPVGDSSGNQSPLSFGGFGAMVRHLHRLTEGIEAALQADVLNQEALALLQPYQPNLSVTWLFQRAMSARIDQTVNPHQINQLLSAVFQEMAQLGDGVLKPFLQDVIQFSALSQTLAKTALAHPQQVLQIVPHVGLASLLDWTVHYCNLGLYTGLYSCGQALNSWIDSFPPQSRYWFNRWIDAWKYGSGSDYRG
jgi:lycopene cyclase CruP